MSYFTLRNFAIYNNITHEKMEFDPSETEHLFRIFYDYKTYVKDGTYQPEEFHQFLRDISSNFLDVTFNVIYKYNLYCAHCCEKNDAEHNDIPCIYSNSLKICNSVITDRING
jgi:hypothetical protein